MAGFNARTGLEELEEYAVEHVAADIIVNANESNYNLPRPIEQAVAAKLAGFPFNRYPPQNSIYYLYHALSPKQQRRQQCHQHL